MFSFSLGTHGPDAVYGAVIDIGSGSVGVAIVVSEPGKPDPHIVWSAREYSTLKNITNLTTATKDIATTIMNAILLLGSTGGKALREYDSSAHIKTVQVAISAPWSYTASQSVSTTAEAPFEITTEIITELETAATTNAAKNIDNKDVLKDLGLIEIYNKTTQIRANGYPVVNPEGQRASDVSVTRILSATESQLVAIVTEGIEKTFPDTPITFASFMLQFYTKIQSLPSSPQNYCLIDVTAEATEIGIVREGILTQVTHLSQGTHSIAREISDVCNIPVSEAIAYLTETNVDPEAQSKTKTEKLTDVYQSYEDNLGELFTHSGDILSIPRQIFLHTDLRNTGFFKERIKHAARKAFSRSYTVQTVTKDLFKKNTTADSALLFSATVFHTQQTSLLEK